MRKIIALVGEPAVGKSTIMKAFLAAKKLEWQPRELTKLVPTLYNPEHNLHVLGRYDEGEKFPGTDRFSMAVQPAAIKFVQETKDNILFEGDRLGTQSFLEFLAEQDNTDFKLFFITADERIVDQRHDKRGDNQTDIFKKSRATKISNLRSNMVLMGSSEVFINNTPEDGCNISLRLLQEFGVV